MRDLCYGLVRVLDFDGQAKGQWDPKLTPERLRVMLRYMMLVRAFDDRMFRAQRQGKTSFYMKCTGEEATSVASTMALDRGDMRSEEHTSELQSLMRISYAVFCLKKTKRR